jgi:butyryl-CoA dehydrogenase
VKGLSLFIVPKYLPAADGGVGERNDVVLAGLNHKMGFRGTTNTLLNFGEGKYTPEGTPGAIGFLVGEPNKGLVYMFHMMNEARLAVGAGAVALGYTGYLHARSYARDRTQGRALEGKSSFASPVPIIRHPDVRRMLLASKSYVEGGLGLVLYSAMVLDRAAVAATTEEAEELNLLLDVLTPIVKAWPSMWCLKANDMAIQIHGGYGYSREYPVEQFYRDNRLNPIHEGTDGIQSLDLVGRKLKMNDGAGLSLLERRIAETISALPPSMEHVASDLRRALDAVVSTTRQLWETGDGDVSLGNSYTHAAAVGHLVVAWLWADQLRGCDGLEGEFYEGKRLAATYFFTHELPAIHPALDLLRQRDRLFLSLDENCL